MTDYEQTFDDFWRKLVENEDGTLNADAVKRELHDYRNILGEVRLVFSEVTGGSISKPNTLASEVILVFNDLVQEETTRAVHEAVSAVLADLSAVGASEEVLSAARTHMPDLAEWDAPLPYAPIHTNACAGAASKGVRS